MPALIQAGYSKIWNIRSGVAPINIPYYGIKEGFLNEAIYGKLPKAR
jgi:hypothetical protein